MAATEVEVELQELDQIAADLTKGCHSSTEDKLVMERCDFTPKNKNIDGEEIRDMNEYVMSYFESLNSMSRRIIAEHRQVIEENKHEWAQLKPEQQDRLIDDKIVDPKIRKKYGDNATFDEKREWFPVLKLAHGLSDSDRLNNPRDSIASVTFQELHSRDQFSSPWSWETKSQEDLRILKEGELQETMKRVTEQEERAIHNPIPQFKIRKKFPLFDCESKNSSRTASTQGSEPLTRKDFMDIDLELKDVSKEDSVHSSKGSLASFNDDQPLLGKTTTKQQEPQEEFYNGHDEGSSQNDMMAFLKNW